MLTGVIDRYEEFARGDLELCRSAGWPWVCNSYGYLGLAHLWRGRWQEALEEFEEGTNLEPTGFVAGIERGFLFLEKAYAGEKGSALAMLRLNPLLVPLFHVVRQVLLRRRRWLPRVLAYVSRRRLRPDHPLRALKLSHIGNLPRPGQANTYGTWLMLMTMVEGLAVLGERRKAAKLYPLVLDAIATGTLAHVYGYRLLQTVAGIAAAAGRQWEVAEQHYETALRQTLELPHVSEQPEVRRWYAQMLLDRDGTGDPDKARELLTEAIAMYRKMGMPKHVEIAEVILGEV